MTERPNETSIVVDPIAGKFGVVAPYRSGWPLRGRSTPIAGRRGELRELMSRVIHRYGESCLLRPIAVSPCCPIDNLSNGFAERFFADEPSAHVNQIGVAFARRAADRHVGVVFVIS